MIKTILEKIRRQPAPQPPAPRAQPPRVEMRVDHAAKTMTGAVYLGRAERCPQRLARRDKITGKIVAHEQCTGESGHPSPEHCDLLRRKWS